MAPRRVSTRFRFGLGIFSAAVAGGLWFTAAPRADQQSGAKIIQVPSVAAKISSPGPPSRGSGLMFSGKPDAESRAVYPSGMISTLGYSRDARAVAEYVPCSPGARGGARQLATTEEAQSARKTELY